MSKAKLNKIIFSGTIDEVRALDSAAVKTVGTPAVIKQYHKRMGLNK